MTTASQIITDVVKLDQLDTLLAILGGTNVTATITVQSSAGGPQSIAIPVTAADIATWQAKLTTARTATLTSLAALGITLT